MGTLENKVHATNPHTLEQRCKNVTLGVISPHYLLLPILVRAMELREDIVTLTETTPSAQS